jgi:hypothetical protein
MRKIWLFCVALAACLINISAFGQTTKPATQPDYRTQESVLAKELMADNDRLIATTAAQASAQRDFDADKTQLHDVLVSDIDSSDADIAAARVALFLQDPSENGERKWAHPEFFPKETEAMTVWGAADVDVIGVRDFWFIIDGQRTLHVSGIKPASLNLSNMSRWDYPADKDIHVGPNDINEEIDALHKKLRLAVAAYPEHANDFCSSTILFQSERTHYTPTAWDDSRQEYVGGDTDEATINGYPVAENGSYYGEISTVNGLPRTHYVNGYYRSDGTYVRSYYRSR